MESPIQSVTRYSDADLAEFKTIIEKKLASAYEELEYLREQINDTTENMEKDSDYMEDSTSYSDIEMFQNMAYRQQKHIQNLENALIRVKNKSYGICTATGKLIDKRRLLVVPTTTMSIDAKLANKPAPEKKESRPSSDDSTPSKPKVISKPVASKPSSKVPLDDLDIFDDTDDDTDNNTIDFDLVEDVDDLDE